MFIETLQMPITSLSGKKWNRRLTVRSPRQDGTTPLINHHLSMPRWEPTSNFDRLLAWMWGPPGCANGQTEQDVPDDGSPIYGGTVTHITD